MELLFYIVKHENVFKKPKQNIVIYDSSNDQVCLRFPVHISFNFILMCTKIKLKHKWINPGEAYAYVTEFRL